MRLTRLVLALIVAVLLYFGISPAFGADTYWPALIAGTFASTAIIGTFTDKDPL